MDNYIISYMQSELRPTEIKQEIHYTDFKHRSPMHTILCLIISAQGVSNCDVQRSLPVSVKVSRLRRSSAFIRKLSEVWIAPRSRSGKTVHTGFLLITTAQHESKMTEPERPER